LPSSGALDVDSHSGLLLDTVAPNSGIFLKSDGSTSTSGIRSVDIGSGTQTAEATIVDIYGSASPNQIVTPICITPNGEIVSIGRPWAGNGTAQISLLNRTTFALIEAWNDTDAGGGLPVLPYAPGLPQCLVATSKQSISYVAAPITATLAGGTVNILEACTPRMQFAGHSFDVDEDAAVTCGSPANIGKFFTLGYSTSVSATAIGVYVTTISNGASNYDNTTWAAGAGASIHIATVKAGTIDPTDIDMAWTNFSAVTQPGYDQDDDKLIAFFQTTDVVTHQSYLAKIDPADGSIEWATPLSAINERFSAMGASNINGVYWFLSGTRVLYEIDLSDGSITSQATLSVGGGISTNCWIWDHATSSGFFSGQWASPVTPPYPVGGISESGDTYWYRLQVDDVPADEDEDNPPEEGSDDVVEYPPITTPAITQVRQLRPHPRPPIVEYRVGSGERDTFPISFRVMEQQNLRVAIDDEELDQTDFTFTGRRNGNLPGYDGGIVTLDTAITDCIVRIWSDPVPVRTTDFLLVT
jgi:hypothetical protein